MQAVVHPPSVAVQSWLLWISYSGYLALRQPPRRSLEKRGRRQSLKRCTLWVLERRTTTLKPIPSIVTRSSQRRRSNNRARRQAKELQRHPKVQRVSPRHQHPEETQAPK